MPDRLPFAHAQDILLWPDGFWCLREEFSPEFLRDDGFRVIPHRSETWLKYMDES